MTETSTNNIKALKNFNEKVLTLMSDNSMIAPSLASFFVNLFKNENKSQYNLIIDRNSFRMKDFWINGEVSVTLYSKMLTSAVSNKSCKLDEDLVKTITKF